MRRRVVIVLVSAAVAAGAVPFVNPVQAASTAVSPSATRVAAAALTLSPRLLRSGFKAPTQVVAARDQRNRLYVVEQAGRVRAVEPHKTRWTYLDIRSKVNYGGERGLLGLAFSPTFVKDRKLFVTYTRSDGALVLGRLIASAATARTVSSSTLRTVLVIPHPNHSNHNGGSVAFGPDGFLYLGTGDGGGAGDPYNTAGRLSELRGKILRINPLRSCGTKRYCVPSTNPFRGVSGARPEIMHLGVRNPWRFSFAADGTLWIGDVGQDAHEEIDALPAGAKGLNLGWSCWEGKYKFAASRCRATTYTRPVIDIPHSGRAKYRGESVTGGYVYRGSAFPAARGAYVFADFITGNVWSYRSSTLANIGSLSHVTSFGEGDDRELYVVTYDGGLFRLRF